MAGFNDVAQTMSSSRDADPVTAAGYFAATSQVLDRFGLVAFLAWTAIAWSKRERNQQERSRADRLSPATGRLSAGEFDSRVAEQLAKKAEAPTAQAIAKLVQQAMATELAALELDVPRRDMPVTVRDLVDKSLERLVRRGEAVCTIAGDAGELYTAGSDASRARCRSVALAKKVGVLGAGGLVAHLLGGLCSPIVLGGVSFMMYYQAAYGPLEATLKAQPKRGGLVPMIVVSVGGFVVWLVVVLLAWLVPRSRIGVLLGGIAFVAYYRAAYPALFPAPKKEEEDGQSSASGTKWKVVSLGGFVLWGSSVLLVTLAQVLNLGLG